ncbi:MAG TPA: nucleotidyltransferase domain-containing protein [Chitinophagales bacterium]|nr:nucleotidyltransferase domain-containing protein [Chitinophagales bacterium]HNL84640.1 nucleotidyltransferase domain-containing protein [Chitinophagales bacterium]
MTIDDLKSQNLILFECISGSKAYGLDTATSDTDIKGVFLLPKEDFYGLNYIPQVSNETNDIVYYELGRYFELLLLNNPNILELLSTPENKILYKHPFLNAINAEMFLSKLCFNTFGQFAISQIKKAKGLNKKILNPIEAEKKNILNFCTINYNQGSISLNKFLEIKNWTQNNCGLVNIPNMKNVYGLYYSDKIKYNGIIRDENSNEVLLSSIPKEEKQEAILYFNKEGYTTYCKEYKEYWSWVGKRNTTRYENTLSHGKNYDAKNMMHVLRLLDMAIEIANEKKIFVKRPNRDFLLMVKSGELEYDEIMEMANKKKQEMEMAFENSSLPDMPDVTILKKILVDLRCKFYA